MKKAPANTEAEEGLLASCFIDGGSLNVVGKAIESGITPDSFYLPKNASIWQAIATVHASGETVDEFSVATELNRRGQLDLAGGMAELSRIAGRVETASGWMRYQVEVTAKHTARKAQNEANRAIESLSRGDDLGEVLTRAEKAFAELAGQAGGKRDAKAEKLAAALSASRFDPNKVLPEPAAIITLGGKTIFTEGNISAFLAGKSSGKTSSVTAMIASMIGASNLDYLGFQGFNPHGKSVIYFDTEQSEYDFQQMQRRIAWRARVNHLPEWVESYHIKPFKTADRFKAVMDRIKAATAERGCLLAIIDGAVDLVANFNDIEVSNDFMDELMSVTHATKAHIHCTLHTNPGQKRNENGDKGRGHLGTFLEQRSETVLLSTKKRVGGVEEMVLDTKDARHGILGNPPRIRWNDKVKMLMTYSGEQQEEDVAASARVKLARVLADAFSDSLTDYRSGPELVKALCAAEGWAEGTAKNRITDMKKLGLLTETNGLYSRA